LTLLRIFKWQIMDIDFFTVLMDLDDVYMQRCITNVVTSKKECEAFIHQRIIKREFSSGWATLKFIYTQTEIALYMRLLKDCAIY